MVWLASVAYVVSPSQWAYSIETDTLSSWPVTLLKNI